MTPKPVNRRDGVYVTVDLDTQNPNSLYQPEYENIKGRSGSADESEWCFSCPLHDHSSQRKTEVATDQIKGRYVRQENKNNIKIIIIIIILLLRKKHQCQNVVTPHLKQCRKKTSTKKEQKAHQLVRQAKCRANKVGSCTNRKRIMTSE